MPTYRKRGSRWQVQVRRQGFFRSQVFDTKAAAERWARRIEREIDEGKVEGKVAAAGTVSDLLKSYEAAIAKVRPIGRSKYGVLAQLERGIGSVLLKALTDDVVLEHAARRRKEGAGPVTVGLELSLLGTILRSAHGLLGVRHSDEPVRRARQSLRNAGLSGKSQERDRRPTRAELEALCSHFRDNPRQRVPMGDIIEFAVATAMRREEIMRLAWSDLNDEQRVVTIRDRKDPRKKIGNHETVPLLDVTGYDAMAIIQRQRRQAPAIFPYEPDTVTTTFARACNRLQIVDLRFHDLRHEGVSRMFEAGMTIEEVALCSGHKDWKTLRRYTHLKAEDLARRYGPSAPATSPKDRS